MCIAICTSPNTSLTEDQLLNCHTSNKDGCGFAYISTDYSGVRRLKTYKTMDFQKFKKQYYRAVKNNPESPMLVHFRIATHGTVDKFNCHPFKVNKRMVMIHNGIINGMGVDKNKSDTQLFNDKILKTLPKGWENSEGISLLIEKFIIGSKMLTLDIDGTVRIYNESAGHWKDGIWFSNNSYVKPSYNVVNFKNGKVYPQTYYIKETYCDGCTKSFNSYLLNYYKTPMGELLAYCKDCSSTAINSGEVRKKDGISRWFYEQELKDEFGREYC